MVDKKTGRSNRGCPYADIHNSQNDAAIRSVDLSDLTDKGAMTIPEFCHWAGIGRSLFYKLVNSKQLPVRKAGKRTLILTRDAVNWLESLPNGG